MITRLVTEEHRVLTQSLDIVLEVHNVFDIHKFDWMDRDMECYNEEIVWKFYSSYVAILRWSIDNHERRTK